MVVHGGLLHLVLTLQRLYSPQGTNQTPGFDAKHNNPAQLTFLSVYFGYAVATTLPHATWRYAGDLAQTWQVFGSDKILIF